MAMLHHIEHARKTIISSTFNFRSFEAASIYVYISAFQRLCVIMSRRHITIPFGISKQNNSKGTQIGMHTAGYSWRVQLFMLPDLPFISPFLRTRPETYTTSGPKDATHALFSGSCEIPRHITSPFLFLDSYSVVLISMFAIIKSSSPLYNAACRTGSIQSCEEHPFKYAHTIKNSCYACKRHSS